MIYLYIFVSVLSLLISYFICRFIIYFSHKKGLLDPPNEFRQHDTPTPYFGGIAIFISFIVVFYISCFPFWNHSKSIFWLPVLFLSFFLVGLIDDIFKLSSTLKLLLIILASLIPYYIFSVFYINFKQFFPIFLCLIFFTNAFNLLDNIDGLCASTGIAVLTALAIYNFNFFFLVLIFAIAGFLILNFPKAKIFMGDTGSLLIGAICVIFAFLSMKTGTSGKAGTHILNYLPLFWLPIYDTFSVIIVRLNAGKSVLIGGKDHFSHRLMKRGMSNWSVITVLFFITLIAGTLSLFSPPLFSTELFIFLIAASASYELLTRSK